MNQRLETTKLIKNGSYDCISSGISASDVPSKEEENFRQEDPDLPVVGHGRVVEGR